MGKKMKLIPFLSKPTNKDPTPPLISPFQWPSCGNIETLSFRAAGDVVDDIFRMVNSTYAVDDYAVFNNINFSSSCAEEEEEGSSSHSFSTTTVSGGAEEASPLSPALISLSGAHVQLPVQVEDPVEMVIKGLRSERLFFEPGETNSILGKPKSKPKANNNQQQTDVVLSELVSGKVNKIKSDESQKINKGEIKERTPAEVVEAVPYKESVIMSMESNDPYVDFRRSMEEMVEAHGLKDWEGLEELLSCYLKVNGKSNHGYIVGAFVDLLVNLSLASLVSSSSSISSSSKSNKNNKSSSSTTTVSVNCSSSSSLSFSIPRSSSSPPTSLPPSPVRSTSSIAATDTASTASPAARSSSSLMLLDQVAVEYVADCGSGGEDQQ